VLCQPGHWSSSGLEPCHRCAAGTYQNKSGATDCISCSPHRPHTLSHIAAVSTGDCFGLYTVSGTHYRKLFSVVTLLQFLSPGYRHSSSLRLSLLSLLTNTLSAPSASEVTTLWRYTNLFIIIIIIIDHGFNDNFKKNCPIMTIFGKFLTDSMDQRLTVSTNLIEVGSYFCRKSL